MYPAQRDEVMLVLVHNELLLILHVTTVMAASLLRHKQVGDLEGSLGLERIIYTCGIVNSRIVLG